MTCPLKTCILYSLGELIPFVYRGACGITIFSRVVRPAFAVSREMPRPSLALVNVLAYTVSAFCIHLRTISESDVNSTVLTPASFIICNAVALLTALATACGLLRSTSPHVGNMVEPQFTIKSPFRFLYRPLFLTRTAGNTLAKIFAVALPNLYGNIIILFMLLSLTPAPPIFYYHVIGFNC